MLPVYFSGSCEMTTSDGDVRVLGPGTVLLAEDTTQKGHISQVAGPDELQGLIVMLPADRRRVSARRVKLSPRTTSAEVARRDSIVDRRTGGAPSGAEGPQPGGPAGTSKRHVRAWPDHPMIVRPRVR